MRAPLRTALLGAGLACGEGAASRAQVEAQQLPDRIGELTLSAAVGRVEAGGQSGAVGGGVASFAFQYRFLSLGPEFQVLNGAKLRARSLGAVIRLRQRAGMVRPQLTLGIGGYVWQEKIVIQVPQSFSAFLTAWNEIRYLSGSLGLGLLAGRPESYLSFLADARWHRNLQQDEVAGSRSLLTLALGARVVW